MWVDGEWQSPHPTMESLAQGNPNLAGAPPNPAAAPTVAQPPGGLPSPMSFAQAGGFNTPMHQASQNDGGNVTWAGNNAPRPMPTDTDAQKQGNAARADQYTQQKQTYYSQNPMNGRRPMAGKYDQAPRQTTF